MDGMDAILTTLTMGPTCQLWAPPVILFYFFPTLSSFSTPRRTLLPAPACSFPPVRSPAGLLLPASPLLPAGLLPAPAPASSPPAPSSPPRRWAPPPRPPPRRPGAGRRLPDRLHATPTSPAASAPPSLLRCPTPLPLSYADRRPSLPLSCAGCRPPPKRPPSPAPDGARRRDGERCGSAWSARFWRTVPTRIYEKYSPSGTNPTHSISNQTRDDGVEPVPTHTDPGTKHTVNLTKQASR